MSKIGHNTFFNRAPTVNARRTRFDLSHCVLDTFDTGDLVTFLCEPVYPGDTFSLKTASLTRLETSLHQTMDNAYVEFAYFFVPSRILWKSFPEYQGFNRDAWARLVEKTKPQILLGATVGGTPSPYTIVTGSLLNHLALPSGTLYPYSDGTYESIDQLPLRAVFSIYNNYFRDQNLDSEIYFDDGDADVELDKNYLFNGAPFNPATTSLKVNRFKDMFSTALPGPQKSANPVSIALGGLAPVITQDSRISGIEESIHFRGLNGALSTSKWLVGAPSGDGVVYDGDGVVGSAGDGIYPDNLFADLSGISAVTINELRLAIALQAKLERDARTGNRLVEKLKAVWNVDAPALELDIPEFLGGKRIPVSMMEVLQTSETGTTVLGTDAGHSKTVDSDDSFTKSFTQWGYIIGMCWVRTSRSYSQGIDRKFFVKNLLDEYDPMFDHVGEMDVYKKELYALAANGTGKDTFGFQEAWYWLKSRLNRFTGYFQPGITGSMADWHYGDFYNDTPNLSPAWLKETDVNVDRTIAVQSGAPQWSINISLEMYATREMSLHSIPNTFGF